MSDNLANALPGDDDLDDFNFEEGLSNAMDGIETPPPAQEKPVDTPADAAQRARDEAGRFAKGDAKALAGVKDGVAAIAAPVIDPNALAAPVDPLAPVVDAPRPPPGWSVASKVAFDALPDVVKADIAKREVEIDKGLSKLREYKAIDPYVDMARSSNTTLDVALDRYTKMEKMLQTDFLGGIAALCRNAGVQPASLAQAIFARSGGSPDQAGNAGNQPQANQAAQGIDLSPIQQRLSQLEGFFQQQKKDDDARKNHAVHAEIEAFKADPNHPYLENVRPQMARLLDSGMATTLTEAYESACWTHPEIKQLLIKKEAAGLNQSASIAQKSAAATNARVASTKSITGSPNAVQATPSYDGEDFSAALNQAWDG